MDNRNLFPIDLIIASGTSLIIVVPEIGLTNRNMYNLFFKLNDKLRDKFKTQATGTESVAIQVGVNGTPIPLLDNAANIFLSDLLFYTVYRLRYGNNGLPAAIPHFIALNTPRFARPIDPANPTGTIEE